MHKNTKRFSALFAVLALVVLVSGCKQAPAPAANTNVPAAPEVNTGTPEAAVTTGETKVFDVSAANFSFDVKEIRVKKGDTVKINFKNNEGFHDWVVDDFLARTKQLQSGQSETIEFVANKAGTFEYYCSVGQHRKFGMVGNLIVE